MENFIKVLISAMEEDIAKEKEKQNTLFKDKANKTSIDIDKLADVIMTIVGYTDVSILTKKDIIFKIKIGINNNLSEFEIITDCCLALIKLVELKKILSGDNND